MNLSDIHNAIAGELIDPDAPEFFALASSDMIDGIMGQYRDMRSRIEAIARQFAGPNGAAVHYFLAAARSNDRHFSPPAVLFDEKAAISALDAESWSKTIQLTDVIDSMPQARRDEWHASIRDMTCPEFTEDTVRATIETLLASRSKFFAERVDGIFRNLSGEHITNSPAGFGKRMILNYVLNDYYSVQHGKAGYINDLRCVIAKFMGRDEPKWGVSANMIETLKHRWGEWVTVDGGAVRIRLYKKGTAHLEVHPDMAWRLNSVLSSMYPAAIPEEFRRKPKREKRAKEYQMIQRPLPFAVLEVLSGMSQAVEMVAQPGNWREQFRRVPIPNAMQFSYASASDSKPARHEAEKVLEAIGGTKTQKGYFQFDYEPRDVIRDIVASGCIPDQKAHQYYPTPERLARIAVEAAQIGPDDSCLEPSAGIGGLADLMPMDRTVCVEVSDLHCKVLKSKGHTVDCSDFIQWAKETGAMFDRVVMNPPFSEGRAQAHVEAAANRVKPGGRLVAILPASMRNKFTLPGFDVSWSAQFDNEFAGASVSVSIMEARKA
jgi:hypothetical protein